MKILFRLMLVFALAGVLFGKTSAAITWHPEEFTCPIDKTKNTFLVVGSYGSYIYSYPSKYQWLFFPQTDSPTYYICKKCHLATFMWDFDKLPAAKLPAIQKILAGVKVQQVFKDYQDVPVTERLEIMEKVYSVLDKEDDWWESFYRIKGYHYAKAGDDLKATENRKKSLDLVQKELAKNSDKTPRKLLLYVSAAMKHFTGDDAGALGELEKALSTKYQNKDEKPEQVKSAEEGLNARIKDYIEKINSKDKKPRMFDKSESDEH